MTWEPRHHLTCDALLESFYGLWDVDEEGMEALLKAKGKPKAYVAGKDWICECTPRTVKIPD
jgi:predicted transcriptional regulator